MQEIAPQAGYSQLVASEMPSVEQPVNTGSVPEIVTPPQIATADIESAVIQLQRRQWIKSATDEVLLKVAQLALYSSEQFRQVRLLRVIGKGGAGVVFEAVMAGQRYALKYTPIANNKELNSFKNAYRNIRRLQSEPDSFRTVVLQQELDESNWRYMQLMRLMDTTLDQVLKNEKPDWQVFRDRYFLPILEQLKQLHSHRLYHRDLKIDNIGLLEGVAYLLDLDLLYEQLEHGDDGFQSTYGPPEFAVEDYLEHIMNGLFHGVDPLGYDLVSLAHIWLAGRLGVNLPQVYRDNLEANNPVALDEYYDNRERHGDLYARAMLADNMLFELRRSEDFLQQLFSLKGQQVTTLDRLIVDRLWLRGPIDHKGLVFVEEQLRASTSPDELLNINDPALIQDEEVIPGEGSVGNHHQVPAIEAPMQRLQEVTPALAEVENLSPDNVKTLVAAWLLHPQAQLVLRDEGGASLVQEITDNALIFPLEDLLYNSLPQGMRLENYMDQLGLRQVIPVFAADGGINRSLLPLFSQYSLSDWVSAIAGFCRYMQAQHQRGVFWPELVLKAELNHQTADNGLSVRMIITTFSATRVLPESSGQRMDEQLANMMQLVRAAEQLLLAYQAQRGGDFPAEHLSLMQLLNRMGQPSLTGNRQETAETLLSVLKQLSDYLEGKGFKAGH